MKCREQQELAALEAAGALDRPARSRLEAEAAHEESVRDELAASRDAITAYAAARVFSPTPKSPPPALRTRILDQLRSHPRVAPQNPLSSSPDQPPPTPGFTFVPRDSGDWLPTAIPSLRIKILSVNPKEGYRTILAELSPGGTFPAHVHHAGSEQLYVVSGDLETEGHSLKAGDFLHAQHGTEHHALYSPNGCVALIVEPIRGPEFPSLLSPKS